jgi:ParB/RepB/Spo0J family partition protein
MPAKTNEACIIKIRQITKNPELSLGMSQKDVRKYKKVAAEYGNVAPVIVGAPVNGEYLILTGSARLEALAEAGIKEIPAVMTQTANEKEQLKLSLILSSINEESAALSEGALIARLVNEYSVTPRELINLLGKSKAWISKRMSLSCNLSDTVKTMVTDGTLCPRSAEEVAKLPEDVQVEFAVNVVNLQLNKNEISELIGRYKNASDYDVCREVIKSPLSALSKIGVSVKKGTAANSGLNTPERGLVKSANYAAQMMLKAVNMAENAAQEALLKAEPQLKRLKDAAAETDMILNRLLKDVVLPDIKPLQTPDFSLKEPFFSPSSNVSPGKPDFISPATYKKEAGSYGN